MAGITHYRSAGGLGIRLDGGPGITGGIVTPFYDSLLVKVSASGRRFIDAVNRMERALQEFRVRGVKTNIPFLLNVVNHPDFSRRTMYNPVHRPNTRSVQVPAVRQDRATKLLSFRGGSEVNGFPGVVKPAEYGVRTEPDPPAARERIGARWMALASCSRSWGLEKFSQWVRDQRPLLLTDTTFRDAHQSLLATTPPDPRHAPRRRRVMPALPERSSRSRCGAGQHLIRRCDFLKEDPWDAD